MSSSSSERPSLLAAKVLLLLVGWAQHSLSTTSLCCRLQHLPSADTVTPSERSEGDWISFATSHFCITIGQFSSPKPLTKRYEAQIPAKMQRESKAIEPSDDENLSTSCRSSVADLESDLRSFSCCRARPRPRACAASSGKASTSSTSSPCCCTGCFLFVGVDFGFEHEVGEGQSA